MSLRWRCQKGHETDATFAPASCPVCGDTIKEHCAVNGTMHNATVDFPSDAAAYARTINAEVAQVDKANLSNHDSAVIRNIDVPGYEIIAEIGRGGMGVVYKAKHKVLNRLVALKMILAAEHAGPIERARFQIEAEAVAQLQHPNIVQIYDVGEVEGRPYFSLEFVDGGSLAQKLQGQPHSPRASATLVETIARAVAAAHFVGIVHRDLKPANVLLANSIAHSGIASSLSSLALRAQHPLGMPKITDFGLAKRLQGNSGNTQSGSILGTPSYMAPEQASGQNKAIGAHTDVYSLGVILYEMLTGRPPFLAATPLETIMEVIRDEPTPPRTVQPAIPRDLEVICLKCLEKKPEKRYASALDLVEDLRRFLEGEPISARSATRVERIRKWMRRHPMATGFIGIATVALSAMIVGAWVYHGKLQDALASANKERDNLADEQKRGVAKTIHLMVSNGTEYMNTGDFLRALPWFTEALQLETDDPAKEEMHRVRLAAVLRQCPRLTRAWFHDGRVNDAAFSPDGKQVITACQDGSARVFAVAELGDAKPSLQLDHPGPVTLASFAPDNLHIATVCADHAARLWDARTGKQIGEPLRHANTVTCALFSPDGLRLLTTSADRTARLWDVLTGEASKIVFKHTGAVTHADFSGDGKLVVTSDADGGARVWDTTTGKSHAPVLAHNGPVVCAYFSPDGKRVLTASKDQTARVWDVETGKGLTPFIRRSTPLTDAAFSPNGRDIATASTDGTGRVWDTLINDWRTHVIRHDSAVVDIIFSPDGRFLASGGTDNTARVFSVASGEALTPPLRHNGTVSRVVFNIDGSALLTASQDGVVRLWDIAAAHRPKDMGIHSVEKAHSIVYSSDRRRFLKNNDDGAILVLEAASGEQVCPPLKHRGAVLSASFSPDGSQVLTASADRTAQVWKTSTGEPIRNSMHHGSDVICAVFSPDSTLVATGSEDNTARVWNAETGQPVTPPLNHNATVRRAVFSPDSRCVLTESEDGRSRVWDASTGEAITPAQKPMGWIAIALDAGETILGWDLPPDQRDSNHLSLLARWLSASRVTSNGSLVPLDTVGLHEVWEELKKTHATELMHSTDVLAWHQNEADAAEKTRDWFAAIFHLTYLIETAGPKALNEERAKLHNRRGRAYAEREQWQKAAEDMQKAIEEGLDDESLMTAHALLRFATGDGEGYKAACRRLFDLCGESANGESACRLAWAWLLSPEAFAQPHAIDPIAMHFKNDGNQSASFLVVRGAKLVRAGQWKEAIALLDEGQICAEGIDVPRAWLFLALAEHFLAHDDAAKRWLNQAGVWIERNCKANPQVLAQRPTALTWEQRLELKLLRTEVEKSLAKPIDGKKIDKIP